MELINYETTFRTVEKAVHGFLKWTYFQLIYNEIVTSLGHEKKKPCFTGGKTFQVGSVGRFFFLNIFFFSGGKKDSTKKHKNVEKIWCFLEKNFRKIFSVTFQIFSQICVEFGQNRLLLHDFSKLKKTTPNLEKLGRSRP